MKNLKIEKAKKYIKDIYENDENNTIFDAYIEYYALNCDEVEKLTFYQILNNSDFLEIVYNENIGE